MRRGVDGEVFRCPNLCYEALLPVQGYKCHAKEAGEQYPGL